MVKRLSILSLLFLSAVLIIAGVFPGPDNRTYDIGQVSPRNPEVCVNGDYLFMGSALAPEPNMAHETILRINSNGTYVSTSTYLKLDALFREVNGYGKWEVSNDTIFFYELSPLFYDYYTYYPEMKEFYTELGLEHREEGMHIWPRELTKAFRDTLVINSKAYADNVSVATIKNFGGELHFITDIFNYSLKDIRGIEIAYSIPSSILYTKNNLSLKDVRQGRKPDSGEGIPFFPWYQENCHWQKGTFKIASISKTELSREKVTAILEKDGLRFTVVNPRYYLPESGLRLYEKADEEALSTWMDTVQVGRSYEFELMRPAYPADSIADFPPLQTVPDSIYAADGEAYGYFFGRLKSR